MNQVSRPILSLCMVVKNEAQLLGECLKTLRNVVDEIVIVDTGSTDRTIPIAKSFGARVIFHQWANSLGRARNVCIENARGSWILVLDGDENLAKKDLPKLKRLINLPNVSGYYFPVRNYTGNYNLLWNWFANDGSYAKEEKFSSCPGWSQTKSIRLLQRKDSVRYQEKFSIHARVNESSLKRFGKIEECNIMIHHFESLKKGKDFIARKQTERLEAEMKHAKFFPRHLLAHLNVAKTLFGLKRDKEAIWYLKKAIRFNPKSEQIYLLSGMIYQENGNYDEAVRSLREAIRFNPNCVGAWIVLGMVYESCENYREAEKALIEALKIQPAHPLTYNSLGIVYQNQKLFLQAEEAYRRAIKIHPQHPNAFFNLGSLYEIQKDYSNAKRCYQSAIKANPENAQAKARLNFLSNRFS